MEIERKFKISKIPYHLELIDSAIVYQAYLSIEPEVRIRSYTKSAGTDYKLTIKGEGQLAREEVETPLTQEQYGALLRIMREDNNTHAIRKEFRVYRLETGENLECNFMIAEAESFAYAEVEFDSVEEANAFKVPDFLGEEVTYDNKYKMKNYWAETRLKK